MSYISCHISYIMSYQIYHVTSYIMSYIMSYHIYVISYHVIYILYHIIYHVIYHIIYHHKHHDFRGKKMLLYIKTTTVPETFHIPRRIQRHITVDWSSYKAPLFFPHFNEDLSFLDRFSQNTQISNFTKIHNI